MVPSVKKLKKNKIFVDGNRKGLLFMLAFALVFISIGLFGLKYSQNIKDYTKDFYRVIYAFYFYAGVITAFYIVNFRNPITIVIIILISILLSAFFGDIINFNLLITTVTTLMLLYTFRQFATTIIIEGTFLGIFFLIAYYIALKFNLDIFMCYCIIMSFGVLMIYFLGDFIYRVIINDLLKQKKEKITFMYFINLLLLEKRTPGFKNYVLLSYFMILLTAYITGFMIEENKYKTLIDVLLFIVIGIFQVEWEEIMLDIGANFKNIYIKIKKAIGLFNKIHSL